MASTERCASPSMSDRSCELPQSVDLAVPLLDDPEAGRPRPPAPRGRLGRCLRRAACRGPARPPARACPPPAAAGARPRLAAFLSLAAPYYREDRRGRWIFAVVVVLMLATSAVGVYFSYLSRDFWNALQEKEEGRFYAVLGRFVLAMVAFVPITVAYEYYRQRLAIAWREWLTGRVLRLYFENKVYYALERQVGAADVEAAEAPVDNPDQRIAEDIRSFTDFSLSFFLSLVKSAIDLGAFSFILFSIMPQLFLAILLFAACGTALTVCIGKRLVRLNYKSLQREADFRFSLVRVRENAESIAFYAGEAVEERETDRKFSSVIDNMKQINIATRNLNFFTTYYHHLTWVLPIVVVAPSYFAGTVEMGVISQASSAFGHILRDLSLVVNNFEDISRFTAGIDRLFSFLEAIDRGRSSAGSLLGAPDGDAPPPGDADGDGAGPGARAIRLTEAEPVAAASASASPPSRPPAAVLSLRGLSVATPDGRRVLVRDLDLSLARGSSLLIVGASGAGKSSLLRAIAGLWSTGTGDIVRPKSEDVYFLPQRPYCPPGSLRDQLFYPSTAHENHCALPGMDVKSSGPDGGSPPGAGRRLLKDWTDEELLNILERVDLPRLASRAGNGDAFRGLDAVLDWSNTLSLGEQQRLAYGRLVVNRPRLVVMDESTSALDIAAEKRMYTLLKELSGEGGALTYVSVGHRPTLLAHHSLKLSLREGQGYVSEIPFTGSSVDEGLLLS